MGHMINPSPFDYINKSSISVIILFHLSWRNERLHGKQCGSKSAGFWDHDCFEKSMYISTHNIRIVQTLLFTYFVPPQGLFVKLSLPCHSVSALVTTLPNHICKIKYPIYHILFSLHFLLQFALQSDYILR